uniref:Uncharacterized protein n=1 Tax=Anguilla anguilla TaxID=7936 RepID=A0A0E9TWE7_ANGAN
MFLLVLTIRPWTSLLRSMAMSSVCGGAVRRRCLCQASGW